MRKRTKSKVYTISIPHVLAELVEEEVKIGGFRGVADYVVHTLRKELMK